MIEIAIMIYEPFHVFQSCQLVIVSEPFFLILPILFIIFPIFYAIVATSSSLACNPQLFHVQSKLTPADLISPLLLLTECGSFTVVFILLSITSPDVSTNFLVFFAQVTWLASFPRFNIANSFSAAFLHFPMAFKPSVLI